MGPQALAKGEEENEEDEIRLKTVVLGPLPHFRQGSRGNKVSSKG